MSGSDRDPKLTVPKFTSFKPKEPERSERGSSKVSGGDEKKSNHREPGDHHDKKRRRHESHHRGGDRHRSRSLSPTRRNDSRHVPVPAQSKRTLSDVFYYDRKGDPLISRYGGIDRSQIPSYYRYGGGRVLGSAGRLIIHRDGPRDQFSIQMPGEGSHAFKEKDGLRSKSWRLKQEPIRMRKSRETIGNEDDAGFLSFQSTKKRKAASDGSSSEDEDLLPAYRTIEGKAKGNQILDTRQSETDSDSQDDMIAPNEEENPLQWRSIQLNRQVKDHPEDIQAWVELVDHQDVLLRAGESIDRKTLDDEAHSYTEIKVSMLESALQHASQPADRKLVLNYLMREGVKIWSSKTAAKKWEQVLKDEDDNFTLWKTHLDHTMADIASFQYDDVKNMQLDRLRKVVARAGSKTDQTGFQEAIYVFLRLTRFIHDAGYKELAIAAWQALLELTFFRPTSLQSGHSALVDFQDFWESEVPRIGEPEAEGWRQYAESDGNGPEVQPASSPLAVPDTSKDAYKSWATAENSAAERAQRPGRTMDEGNDDDPFRVVMHSDIEPLLFFVPDQALPYVKDQMLNAFLLFLGHPPFSCSDRWTELASEDQFLSGCIGNFTIGGNIGASVKDSAESYRKQPSFDPPELNVKHSLELYFSGRAWFQCLRSQARALTIHADWVRNATRQLVQRAGIEDLAVYHLSLGWTGDEGGIKKLAKALLRQFPSNLGLYNGYALAEYARGNIDVARKVLASAADLTTNQTDDSILLWRTWAWMELEIGSQTLAVKRLCSLVDSSLRKTPDDGTSVSATYVLMAAEAFKAGSSSSISMGATNTAAAWAECSILLSYLTADKPTEPMSVRQGNISAAMDTLKSVEGALQARDYQCTGAYERILQFAARLLYWNASQGYVIDFKPAENNGSQLTSFRPFRRDYMRDRLTSFVDHFPRNTIFLSLLEWSDSSLRVVDETRSLLHEKVLVKPQDCVSSRLFAIEHEMTRGNTNTTRAAFEHAVASDGSRNSPAVWIWYVRFCCARQRDELRPRKEAKDVFYRALKHCPWSKEVMMEAFGPLVRNMESAELRSVYNTITSKGLRVHVDLEDFLERKRGERERERERERELERQKEEERPWKEERQRDRRGRR